MICIFVVLCLDCTNPTQKITQNHFSHIKIIVFKIIFQSIQAQYQSQFINCILFPHQNMQGQKLQELLQVSDNVSQILEFLHQNLLNQNKIANNQTQFPIDLFIEKSIDLKAYLRSLAEGIQTNRALVQLQKQQIQKKKVFLEGLQYYKATLKNLINHSKIDAVDVKEYLESPPTDDTDWIQDYQKQEQKIKNTLQEFKQKQNLYKSKQTKKQELKRDLNQAQEKYKKGFPQQMKKLHSQLSQLSKNFNIKEIQISSTSQFKSKKIQQIYNLLYPLKINGSMEIKHLNQFDIEQLQITIQKGFFEGYDYAKQNKILIQEKPIKFFIASIVKDFQGQKQQILAISTSRRQDFSTQEIFNNLFNKQKVKLVYSNPQSQSQRNINNKYSQLNWISEHLASPSNLINCHQFIQTIKNRVFSLYLVRYALQNMTKKIPSYFNPLFKPKQQAYRHKSFSIVQNKKIFFTKCDKKSFEQYKKDITIPAWVQKAVNNYLLLKQIKRSSNTQTKIYENDQQIKLLNTFIEKNNLEELIEQNFYNYHKFQLIAQKDVLQGYLLIPTCYPKRSSIVRLINYKKIKQPVNQTSLTNIKKAVINQQIESQTKGMPQELNSMQTQLNKQIKYFIVGKNSSSDQTSKKRYPFLIYFQINRLISLLIQDSLQKTIDY